MNSFFKSTLLVFLASFVLALFSCSNSSGGGSSDVPAPTGGTATNPTIYTVTFNANYGNPNPTSTQIFYAETPQALKTIEQLGFSKSGFNFAGWGTAANAMTASYSDGAAYTATKDIVLYAIWSSVSVYSVNIPINANGTVTATPATGIAGTEIVLTNTPKPGYKFGSYTVTAADNSIISVTNGKFRMPAQDVRVTATYSAINYSITCGTFENGTVTASTATATVGTEVTLNVSTNTGYVCESIIVKDASGNSIVATQETEGKQYSFMMPASNVTVSASLKKKNYTISIGSFENGSVTADVSVAVEGTEITLSINPAHYYKLESILVTAGSVALTVSGNGNTRAFIMPAQNVIVIATFKSMAASGEYTVLPEGTDGTAGVNWSYVTFGLWPQTIKSEDVTVDENDSKEVGMFKYCRGSDGEWYVKQVQKPYESGYKYSDGTEVGRLMYNLYNYMWFKVEPIKWRVLTTNYNGTGKKLLLAESILIGCVQYYLDLNSRSIGGNTILPNNYMYSTIRAYLNGAYEVGDTQTMTYSGKGFLQSAFTDAQISLISTTTVDNSTESTRDYDRQTNGAASQYLCSNTDDKIFLLSRKEVTTSCYGFTAYNDNEVGNARIHYATDFAKAIGAWQDTYVLRGGWWRLRSPINQANYASYVCNTGYATSVNNNDKVSVNYIGIVPALCVSN